MLIINSFLRISCANRRFPLVSPNSMCLHLVIVTDYAWKVITETSEEILESQSLEKVRGFSVNLKLKFNKKFKKKKTKKENCVALQEPADEITEMLDRKKKETLAYKRSFFVRMVSDSKIYNPKIVKHLPAAKNQTSDPNTALNTNSPL